ncbi:MAG: hypothetical protein ACKOI0_02850 [Actinomycetota bacterium]
MARKKLPRIPEKDAKTIGALLRGLRRAAGFKAVAEAAAAEGCPAARQTIYAYERGGLTPSLQQFLELVEFYGLRARRGIAAQPDDAIRTQAVAAIARVLTLDAYHVRRAHDLMGRLQPPLSRREP